MRETSNVKSHHRYAVPLPLAREVRRAFNPPCQSALRAEAEGTLFGASKPGGSEGGITNNKFPRPLRERVRVRGQKAAFTLAEVLITLGVIGVVAAITLPSFIQNHQAKVRTEQNRMVQYKLTQATDLMKSHGKIEDYTTTKDFVNELKKYFKIAQICENDNLEQCWPTKIISTDGSEVKVSEMKTGVTFNPNGWTKETIGIITADGTPMILTYKDNCPALNATATYQWQTEDNKPVTNATASCIAAVYDLNGKSRPNKSGQDVRLFNATMLGNKFQCQKWIDAGGDSGNDKTNGLCLGGYVTPDSNMTLGNAEYDKFLTDNSIEPCPSGYEDYCKPDLWVGAMKACKDAGGRLPTMAELATIANSMYGTNVAWNQNTGTQTLKDDPYSLGTGVGLWSSEVYPSDKTYAYFRYFYSSYSYYDYDNRFNSIPRARCVGGS